MYERDLAFIESVTQMSYHASYSPQNFEDAFEKILEMTKVLTRELAPYFVVFLVRTQKRLLEHGINDDYGSRLFYNKIENQIRVIHGIYG